LIRYAEKLYDGLLHDLRQYGRFEAIRIFEEDMFYNVHVITEEGHNFTVTYSFIEDEYSYRLIGIYRGFLKETQKKKDRLTVRETTWLKRDFDEEAHKSLALMKELDDFTHLEYMLDECGGYFSIKLMSESRVPEELIKLARCARLDLSLENLALQKKYQPLFTHRELMVCYNRLMQFMNWGGEEKERAATLDIAESAARHRGHLRLVKAG
jgi:hypothetical protein